MGIPTASDPLGTQPAPTSIADMMEGVIDARIANAWRGRAQPCFDGVPDAQLVMELLARGWGVFRPSSQAPTT